MKAVLDVNILVSAAINREGRPAAIVDAWLDGKFTLLTCATLMEELRNTLKKPQIARRVKPHLAGRLVNQVARLAQMVKKLPVVNRSADPGDDFLLALAEAGRAHFLVTGDKSGLLALGGHRTTRIVTANEFFHFISPIGGRR